MRVSRPSTAAIRRRGILILAASAFLGGLLVPVVLAGTARASTSLFADGFESADFSLWSAVSTGVDGAAIVQSTTVKTGTYAARLSESSAAGSFAYARITASVAQTDLTATGDFQVQTEGASGANVPIFRLLDGAGNNLVNLYRQNQSGDAIWVWYGGTYYKTTGKLPLNTWGNLAVHIAATGAATGTVEVFLNGGGIYQSSLATLPAAGVSSV
ncbi:MAG: hypothetical protein ACREMY_29440, partial [bacterium]